MGRMRIRYVAAAAVLAAAVLALTTCSNPVDLVEAATVEVMKANDRYLEINSTQPLQSALNVDPGLDIRLNLDRSLDTSSVTSASVKIVNQSAPGVEIPWIMAYETDTKILKIRPDPYLGDNQDYTVTIDGLNGSDGSEMLEPISWSFRTGVAPKGLFSISDADPDSLDGYTKSPTVTATVTSFTNADYWFATTDPSEVADKGTITGWKTVATPFTNLPLGTTQGGQQVYAVFAELGASKYGAVVDRTIIYDTVAPTVSSFSINGDAAGTDSSSVTLSISTSDTTSPVSHMQFQNYGLAWSTIESISSTKSWSLVATIGTRVVYARVRDAAGNLSTSRSDAIIYRAPMVTSATLNSTATGTVTVSWDSATADTGSHTYYVYRRDYPGGTLYTSCGSTASTSLNVAVPEGTLYYFHVAIKNSSVSKFVGNYSTSSALGYTSDIAVIYAAADLTYASSLKTTLTNSDGWKTTYSILGTMPSWSVTLIPESLVSATYSAANTFYGYPIIITPNTTLYGTANKVRNVTAHGGGIIGMGEGGARLLDVIEDNYTTWGYSAYSSFAPSDIGWLESASLSSSHFAYTWSSPYWHTPLDYSSIPTTYPSSIQLAYSAVGRIGVYRSDDTIPTGNLYCRDDTGVHYFPVARQDRYMQFGFNGLLDRPFTGKVFTVNMVYRMSLFN